MVGRNIIVALGAGKPCHGERVKSTIECCYINDNHFNQYPHK